MKTRDTRLQIIGIALAILLLLLLHASAAQEDVIQKTFNVTAKGTLYIEADRGLIDVLPSTNDQISITVHRKAKASTEDAERRLLSDHHVEFAQDGNNVRVTAKGERDFMNWFGRKQLDVRYDVRLPATFDADLKTAGGSIKVKEISGRLEAATSGGDLVLGRVAQVKGRTSGGSILLDQSSAEADFSTSGGDIKAGRVTGNCRAHTSGGSIKIEFVGGTGDLHTSGGDIRVGNAGGSVAASTSGGSIDVAGVRGAADLHTTGGDIHAGIESGSVDAATSGGSIRISLASTLAKDCTAHTTGGDIRVEVGGKAAFELDARAMGGDVSSKIPLTGAEKSKRSDSLRGQVNGGGPTLKLRATGGSIHLLARES